MTQYQFETIIKIVNNGAPALAEELNNSLNDLVIDRNNLAKENEELKKELDKLTNKKSNKPVKADKAEKIEG